MAERKGHLVVLSQHFQGYILHGEVTVSQGWMQRLFISNLDFKDNNDKMKDLVEIKSQ